MRKTGTKLFLSLMLSASVLGVGSTAIMPVSVHATETVSAGDLAKDTSASFFSGYTTVDNVSDYVGLTDELRAVDDVAMLRTGYKYLIVFEDSEGNFSIKQDESLPLVLNSSSDITDAMFLSLPKSSQYSQVNMEFSRGKAHLLMQKEDDGSIVYVGGFASKDEVPSIDISFNELPIINVEVKDATAESAVIHAEYSLDDAFKLNVPNSAVIIRVELWSGDTCIERESVEKDSTSIDFTVQNNGKYSVKAITYITENMSSEVEVTSIKTSTPEEDSVQNPDTKAPTITFSSLPDSQSAGTETEITIYSDEKVVFNINGTTSDGYVTEMKFTVTENGGVPYSAVDESGNETEGTLDIKFFSDSVIPTGDRDNFWGDPISNILPQTGELGLFAIIGLGLGLIGGGVFFFFKSKKKKSSGTVDNTEEIDSKATEEVETSDEKVVETTETSDEEVEETSDESDEVKEENKTEE